MGINPFEEDIKVKIKGDMLHFAKVMKKTQNIAKKTTGGIGKSFKGLSIPGGPIMATAGAVTAVTAAFTAFGAKAIKESTKVETAVANLNTLLLDSITPISAYKEAITDLSYEMGIGLVETTDAYYQAVSAGFDDLKEASDVALAASKAAIGGMTELPTSVEAITRVLNSYKLETTEAMTASDMLFNTVKYGVTTFAELAPLIGEVAGAAGAANLPMEQLFGTLATLTKGMKTPQAVSSMNAIIASFISPAKEASDAAKKFGIDLSATALSTGQFANELLKISKLGPEAIATLFPNRIAVKGVFQIASDNAKSLLETIEKVKNGAGQTEKAFETQDQTMAQTFNLLRTAVDNAFTKFGEGLNPVFKGITKWFKENKKTVKEWGQDIGDAVTWLAEKIDEITGPIPGSPIIDGKIMPRSSVLGGGVAPEYEELKKLSDEVLKHEQIVQDHLKKPIKDMLQAERDAFVKAAEEFRDMHFKLTQEAADADFYLGPIDPKDTMETYLKIADILYDIKKLSKETKIKIWEEDEAERVVEWLNKTEDVIDNADLTFIDPKKTVDRYAELRKLVDDAHNRFATEKAMDETWGKALVDGTKKGWENEFPQLEKWIMDTIEGMKGKIEEALSFTVHFEGGSKTYNAKQWGGYAQELASSGYVQGMPGPDMVPAYLTAKEAVISAPVAQDPRNKPLVDNLIAQGQSGGTYHDVSTNKFYFGDRRDRDFIDDEVIPALMEAKRDGRLSVGLAF